MGLAVAGIVMLLAIPVGVGPTGTPTSFSHPAASSTTTPVCPFVAPETFTSRYVNLAAPTFALASGDKLTVTYEFEVTNTTLASINLKLTIPSFFATFPLSNGTMLSSYLAPRSITLTSSAWSNSSLATNSKVMASSTHFSGAMAAMSSQFLAIMGNASYTTVTIAFRWDWSVAFSLNGTVVTSAWSRVATTGSTPTTFYPAPTVQLASTSNKTVQIGATFSTYLSGAVSHTLFHSVLEYASSGNVMRNTPTQTGNVSPALVAVKILPATGPLSPNSLLDHVRDVCSALLFSISVKAVYAPSANVTLSVQPSICGPITFNGTSYASGAKPVVVPSSTALGLAALTCSGHAFLGWNTTSGVSVTSGKNASTTVTVSASGSVTARYG